MGRQVQHTQSSHTFPRAVLLLEIRGLRWSPVCKAFEAVDPQLQNVQNCTIRVPHIQHAT